MLKQRLITAFFLLIGMGWAVFFASPQAWLVIVSIIAMVSFWEWAQLGHYSFRETLLYLIISVGTEATLVVLGISNHLIAVLNIIAILFWVFIAPFWLRRQWHLTHKGVHALVGWLLIFSTLFSLIQIQRAGAVQLLLLFAVIWISDSSAYFIGRAFGKNKLAPTISPGKTWEGAIGALICVIGYGMYLQYLFPLKGIDLVLWANDYPVYFYLMIVVIAILGIEGDLFESWLKRCAGVKDSGFILPGHGGILDRIDALIATLPIMAIWAENIK